MSLPSRTLVFTPTGDHICISDLRPGDALLGSDRTVRTVVEVSAPRIESVYLIRFRDGLSLRCSGAQLLMVQSPDRKSRHQPGRLRCVDAIAGLVLDSGGSSRHRLPLTSPVDFGDRELPIHPYVLGALLGDGGISQRQVYFATADLEMMSRIGPLLPEGVITRQRSGYWWHFAAESLGRRNPLIGALPDLQLMGHRAETKFIPMIYKRAGLAQRIALLQGLLDTDGSASLTKPICYATTSATLAVDIRDIVHSLGGISKLRRGPGTKLPLFWLSLTLPDGIEPFLLSRKADIYRVKLQRPRRLLRSIVEVAEAGTAICQTLTLDGLEGSFLVGDYLVVLDNRSDRRCQPSKYSPRHRRCSHDLC